MKLYGFTGIEKSFTIIDNDVEIEVDYCDYTVTEGGVEIHGLDCLFSVEWDELSECMYDYIDWSVIEQDALDRHNQYEEDYSRENY